METPIPAARNPADTVGGPGGLPGGKFEKKKIANGGICNGICGKDIDL